MNRNTALRALFPVFMTMGVLSCTFSPSTQRLPTVERVTGVYVRCPFHCETITLTRDGRFTIKLDGDLFNNEKAAGSWVITSAGHILLNSDQQPTILESVGETESGIRFKILDHEGNALKFAYGFVYCPQSTGQWTLQEDQLHVDSQAADHSMRLDADGFIHVTNCDPTEFFIELYSIHNIQYSPVDHAATQFVFIFDLRTDFYVTNQLYRWTPGRLYNAIPEERGGGWAEYPLELEKAPNPGHQADG